MFTPYHTSNVNPLPYHMIVSCTCTDLWIATCT